MSDKIQNKNCLDCGEYHDRFCVFKDELWEKYGVGPSYRQETQLLREHKELQSGNFVCFFCFEKRLGRQIQLSDLYEYKEGDKYPVPCNIEWIDLIKRRSL